MTNWIKRGLDLPITGTPAQSPADSIAPENVALLGSDYAGLKPNLLVAKGERVRLCQPVFEDRATPGVQFTAPAADITATAKPFLDSVRAIGTLTDGNVYLCPAPDSPSLTIAMEHVETATVEFVPAEPCKTNSPAS